MTKNHARKNAVRLRMAETSENFTAALRAVTPPQELAGIPRPRRTPPTTGCLFCGRPWEPGIVRKSDEHIWPRWIRKHAGSLPDERFRHSEGLIVDPLGVSFVEIPVVRSTSKASALTLKTREVCKDCNTGWMSRLEQRTEQLVVALASAAEENAPARLTHAEARLVATWAQKTAITNEMTSDFPKVASTAMGQRLMNGDPLRASQVWAARHPDDYMLSIGLAHLMIGASPRAVRDEGYRHVLMTSITYHYMTFLVLIASGQVLPPRMDLARWSLIWPAGGDVSFPPTLPVTGDEVTRRMADQSDWLPFSDVRKPWR